MKKCPNCGAEWQDNVSFCGNCGTKTEALPSFSEETVIKNEPTPVYNGPAPAYNAPAPIYNPEPTYIEPQAAPKKSKKPLVITLIIVLAVLIAGCVAGFLTDWFGLASPTRKIMRAFHRTISADSFTVKMSIEETDSDGDTYSESGEIKVVVNPKAKELTVLGENDESSFMLIDEMYYSKSEYSYSDYAYAYIIDDYIDIDDFFDDYEDYISNKKLDEDKLEDLLEELHLEDDIDAGDLKKLIKEVMRDYLCNKKWLKDAAGYSKSGNVYTFEPDIEKIIEDLIEICEDTDAFSDELQEGLIDELEYFLEELEEYDMGTLKFSITLKKGRIEKIVITYKDDDYESKITISFSNINKTKISNDEIDSFASEVNHIIAEATCPYCGDTDFSNSHGNCLNCNKHYIYGYGDGYCYDCNYNRNKKKCDCCGYSTTNAYTYKGHTLCYECYYDSDYGCCDFCCDYGYLYYYRGYDLCWDCYLDY